MALPFFSCIFGKFINFKKIWRTVTLNNHLCNTIFSLNNILFIGKIENVHGSICLIIRINCSIVIHYAISFWQCQHDQLFFRSIRQELQYSNQEKAILYSTTSRFFSQQTKHHILQNHSELS